MKEFKYEPLREYFESANKDKIELTYEEIEEIINNQLPSYAYKYSTFWSNGGQYHDYAWLDAGWKVKEVALSNYIIFEKVKDDNNYEQLSFIDDIKKNKNSKYQPFEKYLIKSQENKIKLTYIEIENIIKEKLPESAYKYKEWWANSRHNHGAIWLDNNYKVINIELGKSVEFEKEDHNRSFFQKIIDKFKGIWLKKK
ncbi:MAG: hypothetical protein SCJ93_13795 [Bacillota bacterium]|nr:hypothetical protein [Bacillota bacterium]